MKNLVFVAVFALFSFLTSCGNTQAEVKNEPNQIEGSGEPTKQIDGQSEPSTVTVPSVDSVKTKNEKK